MPLMNEDFLRCECGNATFLEKKVVSIHKRARKRDALTVQEPIPTTALEESRVNYYCEVCEKKLNI